MISFTPTIVCLLSLSFSIVLWQDRVKSNNFLIGFFSLKSIVFFQLTLLIADLELCKTLITADYSFDTELLLYD